MNFLEVTKHISDKLDRVIRYTLSNGLTVLLTPYTKVNQINFQLWIKTESVHEEKYLGSGLSHCLEHCIFLGSKNYKNTGEYSKFVEMRGGADNNAHTSYDNTGFYFTLQDKYLEDGLDVLSDLVFNPSLSHQSSKKRKKCHSR